MFVQTGLKHFWPAIFVLPWMFLGIAYLVESVLRRRSGADASGRFLQQDRGCRRHYRPRCAHGLEKAREGNMSWKDQAPRSRGEVKQRTIEVPGSSNTGPRTAAAAPAGRESWDGLFWQPLGWSLPIRRTTSRALVKPRAHNHKRQEHRLTCSMREGSTSALVSVTRSQGTHRVRSSRF